jgi:hypothetical protein
MIICIRPGLKPVQNSACNHSTKFCYFGGSFLLLGGKAEWLEHTSEGACVNLARWELVIGLLYSAWLETSDKIGLQPLY